MFAFQLKCAVAIKKNSQVMSFYTQQGFLFLCQYTMPEGYMMMHGIRNSLFMSVSFCSVINWHKGLID